MDISFKGSRQSLRPLSPSHFQVPVALAPDAPRPIPNPCCMIWVGIAWPGIKQFWFNNMLDLDSFINTSQTPILFKKNYWKDPSDQKWIGFTKKLERNSLRFNVPFAF